MELERLLELTEKILYDNIPYKKDRFLIYNMIHEETFTEENLYKQLTVLDSLYSTNMSKRYFGIQEIVSSLLNHFSSIDEINKSCNKLLENIDDDSTIYSLLTSQYGYNKKGNKSKATSLLSKYFYFVSNYDFPIYDSLVIVNQRLLVEYYNLSVSKMPHYPDFKIFLEIIKSTSIELGNLSYETLDNLLWTIGKLKKSSFSSLIDLEQFKKLIDLSNGIKIDDFLEYEVKQGFNKEIEEILGDDLYNLYSFAISKL